MKRALGLFLFVLLVTSPRLQAQDAFNGKWQTETESARGVERIVFEFQVKGNKVTGAITRLDAPDQQPVKLEGAIEEGVIGFAVQSPDGRRMVKFSGKLNEDAIFFSRAAAFINPEAEAA